jgi:hypothetical protein
LVTVLVTGLVAALAAGLETALAGFLEGMSILIQKNITRPLSRASCLSRRANKL